MTGQLKEMYPPQQHTQFVSSETKRQAEFQDTLCSLILMQVELCSVRSTFQIGLISLLPVIRSRHKNPPPSPCGSKYIQVHYNLHLLLCRSSFLGSCALALRTSFILLHTVCLLIFCHRHSIYYQTCNRLLVVSFFRYFCE